MVQLLIQRINHLILTEWNDYVGLSAVLSQGQAEYTIEGYFKPDTQQTDVIFEQVQAGGGQHTRAAMMTIGDCYLTV